MFSVTYLGTALLCQQLRRQISASEALASKRGEELANLSELNELVIRRMRTGVLVVDGSHRIRLSNEAAWALIGRATDQSRDLMEVSPALQKSLWEWRQGRSEAPAAITFAEGGAEVLPRFVSLSLTDKLFLIFLDDSRIYSGRAEELTLFTLGRLSASIAHEIRNPLAAISYSAQLLDESDRSPGNRPPAAGNHPFAVHPHERHRAEHPGPGPAGALTDRERGTGGLHPQFRP